MGSFVGDLDLPGAASIVRDAEKDMFRLGADEAHHEGYEQGYAAGVVASEKKEEKVNADTGL